MRLPLRAHRCFRTHCEDRRRATPRHFFFGHPAFVLECYQCPANWTFDVRSPHRYRFAQRGKFMMLDAVRPSPLWHKMRKACSYADSAQRAKTR